MSNITVLPWNDWYHFMGHTYGTWLPGDPKGFRTRHHREHVEGDYKHPPPKGKYDARWERAKRLMKRDPVYLDEQQRERRGSGIRAVLSEARHRAAHPVD